ncbi:hypothetical protein L6452_18103 [Arctium lappa]|uniref:Uncharacterized protein n=1 Tax=Arctium lappa TaxID=4217 RepID=A0ACB9C5E3_ARCLA|nr:hypothetical protein L6452_18103 [Arctium lappa]
MILVFFFAFVIHSCLPLLCSATTYDSIYMPNCPKIFDCPAFGPFSYPFYNATGSDTHCGLIKVNCTLNHENIQFGDEGSSYEIAGKHRPGPNVMIRDTTFQKLIRDQSCEALENNFISPTPLLFSISIEPSMILYKCKKGPKYHAENIDTYFNPSDYNSYNSCKDHKFYYNHLIGNTTVPNDLPHTCEVIRLPVKQRWAEGNESWDGTNIFSLLTHQFSISFTLSHSCQECCKEESECQAQNGQFVCLKAKKVLVAGSALLILMLSCAIFIIWRCRNKSSPFSYVSSKDKAPDVEDGSHFFGVSVFSYDELKDATQNFDPSRQLGDGGFGAVYYGKLQDGREVAVKRLYRHNYKRVQQFINEVEILAKLRHPNLVLLYGCTSKQSHDLLLVYEYIPNGTVADHLHGPQANPSLLTWPIRMNIAIETASALAYLHATEIIHRDVKTANILLDHNFCVKVADFGLSRLLPNDVSHVSTTPQGTPGYVDPQYHQRYQLTDKSDVYSFGVVLVELISSMVAIDLSRSSDEISLANLAINRIQRCVVDQLFWDPIQTLKS